MATATADVNKLDGFPRVGWSNKRKRAWSLLQRAKPFVLSAKDGTCFVQSGGSATRVDDDGSPIGSRSPWPGSWTRQSGRWGGRRGSPAGAQARRRRPGPG